MINQDHQHLESIWDNQEEEVEDKIMEIDLPEDMMIEEEEIEEDIEEEIEEEIGLVEEEDSIEGEIMEIDVKEEIEEEEIIIEREIITEKREIMEIEERALTEIEINFNKALIYLI